MNRRNIVDTIFTAYAFMTFLVSRRLVEIATIHQGCGVINVRVPFAFLDG